MARLFPIALLVLTACSVYNGQDIDSEFDTDLEWETGLGDTDTDTDDDGDAVEFWSLDGLFVVFEGAVRPEGSAVKLGYWTGAQGLDCDMEIPVRGIQASTPPRDVPLVTWWEVSLDLGDSSCDWAWERYSTLRLGLGELDPRLRPAMEASGLEPEVTSLYGLYVEDLGDAAEPPVYVFGVAGTEGNYGGEEATVGSAPLPDGAYVLQGLHLLPYVGAPEER